METVKGVSPPFLNATPVREGTVRVKVKHWHTQDLQLQVLWCKNEQAKGISCSEMSSPSLLLLQMWPQALMKTVYVSGEHQVEKQQLN